MNGITEDRAWEIARAAFQELIDAGLAKGDLVKVSNDNGGTYRPSRARVSDGTIVSVREVTSLAEVVLEHGIALRPTSAPRRYVGRCPFCLPETPMLVVRSDKNLYACNSCGEGGDVVTFVMQQRKLNFVEAVEHLAERSGLELRYLPPA